MNSKQTLWFMLVVFFVITGIGASDYLGPNRSVTTYVLQRKQCFYTLDSIWTDPLTGIGTHYGCHLTLYTDPGGGCDSAGSTVAYFTSSACGWPSYVNCSTMSCSPAGPSESIVGCNSGDPGCRSWPNVTTYPEATVSGGISCSNPGSNGWCLGSATLDITANEPVAGYNILDIEGTRNGVSFACSGSSCSVPLSEGNNDFSFWALSSWGDSSSMGSASGGIDTQPPQVSGALSGVTGDDGWYVSTVIASASAGDATSGIGSVTYSLDGGSQHGYTGPVTLGDGSHSIVFYAMDRAGNSSSVSLNANVDTTPPAISVGSLSGTLGENGWYVSSTSLPASASDGGSGLASFSYSLDGGPQTAYTGAVTLGDGSHTVVLTAIDHAGNTSTASQTVDVDTTAPQLALNAAEAFCPSCNQTLAIEYSASDTGSGLSDWQLLANGIPLANGVAAENGTFEWDGSSLPQGTYIITLQGKDLAGNTAQVQMNVILALPTPTPAGLHFPILKNPFVIYPATPMATNTATPASGTKSGGQTAMTQTAAAPATTRTNSVVVAASNPPPLLTNPPITSPMSANSALFGAEAAAVIGSAMAIALDQKRKREEEEAKAAAAAAAFNATQIALEEERAQQAYYVKHQQEKALEQAQYSDAVDQALSLGLSYNEIGHYEEMASKQGYAAAIAALNSYIAGAKQAAIDQAQFEEEERKRKAAEIALAQQWLDNNAAHTQAEMDQIQKDNEARAAAAAAAKAENNKPWWQQAWDNLTTGAVAIVNGGQAIVDKALSDPAGFFEGSMIALGNSGPVGKAVVTTLSNIVFGVTDIVKTVFYPPPGTTFTDRLAASAKLVGIAFVGAYLGIEIITGGALTTAIAASASEALGIAGAGATAYEACTTSDCIDSATNAFYQFDGMMNGGASSDVPPLNNIGVLGSYLEDDPASYDAVGRNLGAHYLNIPATVWDHMTYAERQAANDSWLDYGIMNKWSYSLTTPWDEIDQTSYFYRELQYLFKHGYTISLNGTWLLPPP